MNYLFWVVVLDFEYVFKHIDLENPRHICALVLNLYDVGCILFFIETT